MGRVSKRKIKPEIEDRVFEMFESYIASLRNSIETKEFLTSLLSTTEQVMLAKRLTIALMLAKGFSYQEIDEILKVSKSTVGTVDKQLRSGAIGYKKAIKKILNKEAIESFWNSLEELALSLSLPKQYGTQAYKNKSKKGEKLAVRKRQLSKV